MKYNYSESCTALGMRVPSEGVSSRMGDRKKFQRAVCWKLVADGKMQVSALVMLAAHAHRCMNSAV